MKKIMLIMAALLFVTGCGNVELKNGENAVVSFTDGEGISSNELYEILKEKYGADEIVTIIDTYLLEKEYDTTDEETSYLEQVVASVKSSATSYEMTYEDYIYQYYGTATAKEFNEYILLNYRRSLWIEEYAKTLITDAQVENYYENIAIGDITASHILITSDATDDSTDEEKEAAEEEALQTAKDLIKRLNNGEKFEDLAAEYSDDTASASSGGALGSFNLGDMDANFEDAAIKLEVGAYSKTPVKSQYGYHIIYKTAQAEKDTLENLKEEIIETLATEMLNSDTSLYLDALEALREKYDMKIEDSELKNAYDDYMKELEES